MPETTLTAKSVRITEDEAKWLSAAATKGAVTQNDLLSLALHRLPQGPRSRQPDQARNRLRHREGVQVQAHSAARDGQQTSLARDRARKRGRQRKDAAGDGGPARSRQTSSHRLSTAYDPRAADRAGDHRAPQPGAERTTRSRPAVDRLCCALVDLEPPTTKPRRTRE